MAEPRALLFPGQGSQFVGMGRDLYETNEHARAVFDAADAALEIELSSLCFEGPSEKLTETRFAQPALLTHSIAVLRAVEHEGPVNAVAMAGHSLGEWSALVAAGSLDFTDAVRLVHLRGKLMQSAVPLGVGAMAAVIGLDEQQVVDVCAEASGDEVVVPATFNGSGHIVISGHVAAVERAGALAVERGALKVLPVDVSAPFHSPLMSSARGPLRAALDLVDVRSPSVPVCSTVDMSWPREPEDVRRLLVDQLVEPVRWEQCVSEVVRSGAASFGVLGAGKSLARMVKRLRLGPAVELLVPGVSSA